MNINNYIKNPELFFSVIKKQLIIRLPDKLSLQLMYYDIVGKKLNLKSPVTFCEKLQWLKLHDRKEEYRIYADKYKVKDYIIEKLGSEYVVPTIGVYNNPDEIDFEALPNKCVLKCNHDSGSVIVYDKDKQQNIEEIKKKLNKSLKFDFYKLRREWPYKNMERKIICEEYIGDNVCDYKFYCFNGKVELLHISRGNISDESFEVSWYNTDLVKLNYYRGNYPAVSSIIDAPIDYKKMIEFSEILSQNIPFLRVDFMVVDNKVYFAELTFYPGGGVTPFNDEEFETKLGNMINIDKIK